jgi:predicted nucleic acid-binding Zn ribbon protein
MKLIHCRACWQPMSPFATSCLRCGDVDVYRRRRGIAKLLVFLAAAALIISLAYWAA